YGGKVFGVPYYAGSRVVTYRTDTWKAIGIKSPPTSLNDFAADIHKLAAKNSKTKGFSPVYIAGTDWYFAMSFVYDYGGPVAKGQAMPGFLGGSDLAVPVTSKQVSLAADWVKDFTNTSAERSLQAKGNIPNATNLLGTSVNERAASQSWFVPQAKHWVDVENGNIL